MYCIVTVLENRALRRIFGPKWEEETGTKCIMMRFIILLFCKYY
jgi:hypothetical protein